MMMEQINLYDYLGVEDDPIYIMLSRLKNGYTVVFEDVHVTKNDFGLFELASNQLHEVFSDIRSCYKYVSDLLSKNH